MQERLINYVAEVDGIHDRNVTVHSDYIPRSTNLVKPMFEGLIQVQVPDIGDKVLVLSLDAAHRVRFYLPIRKEFELLTNNPEYTQIEASSGKVQIAASEAIELGTTGLESAILGDTLVSILETLCDALAVETHIGALPTIPTGPPLNAAQYLAVKAQLATAKSILVKLQ